MNFIKECFIISKPWEYLLYDHSPKESPNLESFEHSFEVEGGRFLNLCFQDIANNRVSSLWEKDQVLAQQLIEYFRLKKTSYSIQDLHGLDTYYTIKLDNLNQQKYCVVIAMGEYQNGRYIASLQGVWQVD
ncbi:MAG: hypothetical protein GY810_06305 [Aureispira sp.]|nr:hypothetical protein [Aureispira sp.]